MGISDDRTRGTGTAALPHAVLDALSTRIAALDVAGRVMAVNEAWRRFAVENGAPQLGDVSSGIDYLETCRRASGPETEIALAALAGIQAVIARERDHFALEYPCDSPTRAYWFLLYATPLREPFGGAVVAHLDITARKTAEMALAESEIRFRNLVETTSDWVWEVDANGVYTYASPRVEQMLGYAPGEVLGRTPFDLMPPDEAARVAAAFRQAAATRSPLNALVNTNRHKNGHLVVLETSAVPIVDEDGHLRGYHGIDRDITDRSRAQQARDEILSLVSHDLRTPLSVVSSEAEILVATLPAQGATEGANRARTILRQVKHMDVMIRDLLESVRLESGQIALQTRPVDMLSFVAEIVERIGSDTDRRRIQLAGDGEPCVVRADPHRLERAITNLIVNAFKYSPPDTPIIVRVQRGDNQVEVSVTDQGMGIATEEQPRIFDRFYRTTKGPPLEGLGLGLYITRLIVQAHGGRVRVDSQLGQGSTFRITLPVAGERV